MERLCQIFRISRGTEEEFTKRHLDIWPEMVEAMHAAGFRNYSLFRSGLDVIGYSECHPDVATCLARFSEYPVAERWQASMEGIVLGELERFLEAWHLD